MEVVIVLLIVYLQLRTDNRRNDVFVIVIRDLLDLKLFDGYGIKVSNMTMFVNSASFVVWRVKRMNA